MRELIETTESDVPQKSRDDPNTTTDIFDITPPTPLLAVRCESVHGISRSQPGNSFLLYWSELQTLDDNRWTHTVDDARRLRSTHPPYDLLDTPLSAANALDKRHSTSHIETTITTMMSRSAMHC